MSEDLILSAPPRARGFAPRSASQARGPRSRKARPGDSHSLWREGTLAVGLVLAVAFVPGWAGQQESRKPKLPGLEKIVGGSTRQAFTGRVQSLDLQRNILNIDTVEGKSTEIFPVKKDMRVRTVDGEKLKLTSLTPGTNVIIYYDQRADRRTVREIIVLATGAAEAKKSPPPS